MKHAGEFSLIQSQVADRGWLPLHRGNCLRLWPHYSQCAFIEPRRTCVYNVVWKKVVFTKESQNGRYVVRIPQSCAFSQVSIRLGKKKKMNSAWQAVNRRANMLITMVLHWTVELPPEVWKRKLFITPERSLKLKTLWPLIAMTQLLLVIYFALGWLCSHTEVFAQKLSRRIFRIKSFNESHSLLCPCPKILWISNINTTHDVQYMFEQFEAYGEPLIKAALDWKQFNTGGASVTSLSSVNHLSPRQPIPLNCHRAR